MRGNMLHITFVACSFSLALDMVVMANLHQGLLINAIVGHEVGVLSIFAFCAVLLNAFAFVNAFTIHATCSSLRFRVFVQQRP